MPARLDLLGLLAEHVSDLTSAHPEQMLPSPVPLPAAPYLDAIVQTPEGIVQLIMVEKIRDSILRQENVESKAAMLECSDRPGTAAPTSAKSGLKARS